jgi:hypothetical protein
MSLLPPRQPPTVLRPPVVRPHISPLPKIACLRADEQPKKNGKVTKKHSPRNTA